MASSALFSLHTLHWLYRAGISPESALKRAAIFHDQLLIDSRQSYAEVIKLMSLQASEDDAISSSLADDKRFKEMFAPTSSVEPKIAQYREELNSEITAQIQTEDFKRIQLLEFATAHAQTGDEVTPAMKPNPERGNSMARFWAHVVGLYRELAYDFYLFDHLVSADKSIVGLGSPYHGEAITQKKGLPPGSDLQSTDLEIPDFASLSWDAIIDLRQDRFIVSFRDRFSRSFGTTPLKEFKEEIERSISRDFWRLIKDVEPSVRKAVISGILGNIPLGPIPINPVGIGYAIENVRNQSRMAQEFGWLFFVERARSKAKE